MINTKDTQNRLKSLLDSFDKDYLTDLFEEGEKCGLFPPNKRQNYKYTHGGWTYVVSRYQDNPYANIMRELNL